MFGKNIVLSICLLILNSSIIAYSSEYVPVFIWETSKTLEPTPILHKTSEDSFKDAILDRLKSNPLIVVFSEETLSPEDFAQHDQNGKTIYPNLSKLKTEAEAIYRPYVQNPLGAIRQVGKQITEISAASLLLNFNVPKDDILVVDLNDARDDESRMLMLQRHDSDIMTIYKKLQEHHEDILAIYTSRHTSWIASEQVSHHRKQRSLLAAGDDPASSPLVVDEDNLLFLVNSTAFFTTGSGVTTQLKFIAPTNIIVDSNSSILFDLGTNDTSHKFTFNMTIDNYGYWKIQNLKDSGVIFNHTGRAIIIPLKISYQCGNISFVSSAGDRLDMLNFQIQMFNGDSTHSFGDAEYCVGFTTIPIWTGLFVTLIMLIILSLGITAMMDIRTMDKFDDPKGKTITINVAE